MIVTGPYCHKKMRVRLSQPLFRGRLSVACPECKRQVYGFETTTGDPQDRHQRHYHPGVFAGGPGEAEPVAQDRTADADAGFAGVGGAQPPCHPR